MDARTVESVEELREAVGAGPAVVLFHASWCDYCVEFDPIFDEQTGHLLGVTRVQANLDDEENPLWATFDIRVIPSVLFFNQGAVVQRLDGTLGVGLSAKQLREALQQSYPSLPQVIG